MNKTLVNLIDLAKKAQEKSYSPYSKYPVGASVLTESGKIYTGCNIENVSFGLSICAERVAIFKAVSDGQDRIKAICIVARKALPCGACRQVMIEFADKDCDIICVDYNPVERKREKMRIFKLSRLLYMPFNSKDCGL